jgi:hypothetical protein
LLDQTLFNSSILRETVRSIFSFSFVLMEGMTLNFGLQGSNSLPAHVLFVEPGLVPQGTLYVLQPKCQFDSRNVSEKFDGIQLKSGKI